MFVLVKTGPNSRICATYYAASKLRALADPGSIIPRLSRAVHNYLSSIARGRAHKPNREASPRGRPISIQRPVPRTTALSDQKSNVPRPARTLNQTIRPADSQRPNVQSSGHDRSNRTEAQSRPKSRLNTPTNLPNGLFGALWSNWDVRSKEGYCAWTQLDRACLE
ncbi:unnamed protein product [Microthlaspi erraticum]|uniref:Uncharacterized protein n=1 Tax=Microthlaspi erraticum TaxID=1685480 RepID=A0A6D2HWP3_9BRAS|nr:unnamed protein product [Microthlaspi erraticum]